MDEKLKEDVKAAQSKPRPGMVINTTKVSKAEVERTLKLVKSSFKRTPARLDFDAGEYEAMNATIAICNFDHCENDLDSIRTFYESLYPTIRKMHDEMIASKEEIVKMRKDMLPIVEVLVANKEWKAGDYDGNFKRAKEYLTEFFERRNAESNDGSGSKGL